MLFDRIKLLSHSKNQLKDFFFILKCYIFFAYNSLFHFPLQTVDDQGNFPAILWNHLGNREQHGGRGKCYCQYYQTIAW